MWIACVEYDARVALRKLVAMAGRKTRAESAESLSSAKHKRLPSPVLRTDAERNALGGRPMANPNDLREDLTEARADLQTAFHAAHQTWDRTPASGQGEEAWSPRQAAEHVIGLEVYFTSNIAVACGAPAIETPVVSCATPAEAAAALTRISALCDRTLRHVSEADLTKTYQNSRGEPRTVGQALTTMASHAREHAQQIRDASR